MSTVLPILLVAAAVLLLTGCTISLLCIWVYRDAKARGLEAWVWTLVVLLTSGVGLLLYFLVGRKEERKLCPHCGKAIPASCAYCGYCGAPLDRTAPPPVRRGNKGLIIGAVACLVLTITLTVGLFVSALVWGGGGTGWKPSVSTIYVSNSIGNQWNVSWHYTNKTSTHSFKITEDGPQTLYFEGSSKGGPLTLRVWQGDVERTFDLSDEGMMGSLDLSIFEPGKVWMELDNNDGEGQNVQFTSRWK